MASIETIHGMVPAYVTMLRAIGIDSTEQLLQVGCNRTGRQQISAQTGIGPRLIWSWVTQADLLRVDGIGADELELLGRLGIESVQQLGARGPDRLYELCIDLRDRIDLAETPQMIELAGWVSQARRLEPVVRP